MSIGSSDICGESTISSRDRLTAVERHLRDLADRVVASAGDLKEIRRLIDEFSHVDDSVLECRAVSSTVNVDGVPCEWLRYGADDSPKRLMYVHGGSWMSGSLDGYRAHAGRIAEATGCSVLNINYRLAPENAYPAGLDDCDKVLDWMLRNGPEGEGEPQSTFIAGDSAGANLILALLNRRRDSGKPLPDGAVALSPPTDLTWNSPSIVSRAERDAILRPERLGVVVQVYVQNKASIEDPYVSPFFADLTGLPALLIQVGEAEVLFDDAVRFAHKAEQSGVSVVLEQWPEMPHVFQMFAPYLPQASAALRSIGEFVQLASSRAH